MKKLRIILAALALVAGLGLAVPGPASAAPYCGITWGSLTKSGGTLTTAAIANVRAGQQSCYDRLVIDINGSGAGYIVGYVNAVHAEGSGKLIPLRGGAFLNVTVLAPSAFTPANPKEMVNVKGFKAFRQVAYAGSFESHTGVGVGVRARLPFRVFTLAGPGSHSRLVIDVAHYW